MPTPADKSREQHAPIVLTEGAVAQMIGWELSAHSYTPPFLISLLGQHRDSAVLELVIAEDARRAAKDAADIEAAEHTLAEKAATVLTYDELIDKAKAYLRDIREEIAKGEESAIRVDLKSTEWTGDEYLTLASVEWWARKKYGISITTPDAPSVKTQESQGLPESTNPWLIPAPNDPPASQPWYTAARYFARQLVKDDSTLLTKRDLLASKVVQSLTGVGIYKRGGKKPFDPGTIKKAISNVTLA